MNTIALKNFLTADEVRTLPKTKIEIVNLGDSSFMRATFEPGWKWSECVKPTVQTDTCQTSHVNYVLTGRMTILMDDGTQKEMKAGDMAVIPPGHDAWVVGNEPCTLLDFNAAKSYGKKAA